MGWGWSWGWVWVRVWVELRRRVRESGEAERGGYHGEEQGALLAHCRGDHAHEHTLHEDAAQAHGGKDETDL